MYDNSRVPSYTNVSSRPCRIQYSRWSLNTPTAGMTVGQTLPQSMAPLSSSSFYFPKKQQEKQKLIPNYVNIHPSLTKSTSSRSSNYQRPRSTNFQDFIATKQSTFLHHNDLSSQRGESKAVVGIVKPMIHQRSYSQLNTNNNNNNSNCTEKKMSDLMINSYHHNSTRSLYPATSFSPPPPVAPSVVYHSRPTLSHNNNNCQPPPAPRRHSSISNNKSSSSHRSSRTTSTTSSIAAVNELSSSASTQEHERQQEAEQKNNRIAVDVKRLEMFYGSVGTLVKSARSTARLYTTTKQQLATLEDWTCQQYGVPVWIYNTGANLKRTRQVRLVLAQPESCFAAWSSLVSEQAEVRLPRENYISCWLPDSNVLVVLKFEHEDACRLFFRHYYEILEHERRQNLANPPPLPNGNSLQSSQSTVPASSTKEIPRRYSRLRTLGNKQDKERQQEQFELRRCRSLSKIRTVKKSDISGPINFEHVNHLSSGCNQDRSVSGTATLRSLHASMSHLPSSGTLADRCSKQSRKHMSTLFQPQTTTV